MARIIGLAILALLLSGCGLTDGKFRYPCQDPANWEAKECKPPVCTVNGACPEDLVDLDELTNTETTQTTEQP